jgi:hypothetical protein
MLNERLEKVKSWCQENARDLFVAGLIFLASVSSFGLGRLSVIWSEKQPIRFVEGNVRTKTSENGGGESVASPAAAPGSAKNSAAAAPSQQGKFMASKSGKAYHYPWCPSALKIKEENRVWFQTKEEAEARGYTPAANCPGL